MATACLQTLLLKNIVFAVACLCYIVGNPLNWSDACKGHKSSHTEQCMGCMGVPDQWTAVFVGLYFPAAVIIQQR